MTTLYWFALIVGAGLLLFSLVGDADGGDGTDFGHDGDLAHDMHGLRILSMRTATYFLFAFGATGVLLSLTGAGALLRILVSLLVGTVSGGLSAAAFGWLGKTQSGHLLDDRSLVGLVGTVTLPLSAQGTGKIEVERAGRSLELLARPFDKEPIDVESWRTVVVIDVQRGTALVSPYTESLGSGEPLPRLPKTEE